MFALFSNTAICYADLEDEEEIDLQEIQKRGCTGFQNYNRRTQN